MLSADVRELQRYLVYGHLSPQISMKSWPDLARERSLKVRRRGARGKPDEKKRKVVERLQIDGPEREIKELLNRLPTAHLEKVIGKSLKQVIRTENNMKSIRRWNALCDECEVARSSFAFYEPQMKAIVLGPAIEAEDYEKVFYHEFGHAVAVGIELAYRQSPSKEVREQAGTIRSWMDLLYDEEGMYVSPYALRTGDPIEAFSEAYSLYMRGGEYKSDLRERCKYTYELVDKLVKGEMKWW